MLNVLIIPRKLAHFRGALKLSELDSWTREPVRHMDGLALFGFMKRDKPRQFRSSKITPQEASSGIIAPIANTVGQTVVWL